MPDDEETGFKYSALILYSPPGPSEPHVMHGGKETFAGNILSLVPEGEHDRWREWIGLVAWRKIERAERVVIARAFSAAQSTLNDEERRLKGQAGTAWTAFLLSGASHSSDPAWVMTGEAAGDTRGAPLRTLKTAQEQDRVVHPFYAGRPRYLDLQVAALCRHWEAHGNKPDDSWFWRWLEIDHLLGRRLPLPPILWYALQSYAGARARRLLEFSIPEFIRAAEGVIALERNMGAKAFSDRALRLLPSLRTDEYVGADIEGLLPELYQLRSDCVHGKLPFKKLQSLGDEGQDRAAQLTYVAEIIARESLLIALRHADRSIFAGREELERAWASGAFPSAS